MGVKTELMFLLAKTKCGAEAFLGIPPRDGDRYPASLVLLPS